MPTHSMTGFGEAASDADGLSLSVEVKSVNHRFLDIVFRMPSVYSRFESELGKKLRGTLRRGRVEVSVIRRDTNDPNYEIQFNKTLFEQYRSVLSEALGAKDPALGFGLASVLNKREVLELAVRDTAVETEWPLLEQAISIAVERLVEMRLREGAELETELRTQLGAFEGILLQLQKKAESQPLDFQARLQARLERIQPGIEIDPQRLMQEVAILAERVDVTEELTRLHSHILQFKKVLQDGEGGRTLEFLLQEFGREINTIGSKAQNSEITSLIVEAKAVIEKLKEQVANVE